MMEKMEEWYLDMSLKYKKLYDETPWYKFRKRSKYKTKWYDYREAMMSYFFK